MTVCKRHSTGMYSIGQSQLRICIQINIPVRDICTEGVFICVDFASKMRVESLIRSYQLIPPDFVFTFRCWQKASYINQCICKPICFCCNRRRRINENPLIVKFKFMGVFTTRIIGPSSRLWALIPAKSGPSTILSPSPTARLSAWASSPCRSRFFWASSNNHQLLSKP